MIQNAIPGLLTQQIKQSAKELVHSDRMRYLLEQHDEDDVAHAQGPQLDPEVKRHARGF